MAECFIPKEIGCFDVALIDPPWSYYGAQDKMGAAAKFYETMSDDELKSMNIADSMHKKSVVFVWVTSPRLDFGIDLVRHWGLHYRGISFVWVKTRADGKPIGAQGVRPSIVKPTTEFVIAASFSEKGRPLPLSDESIPQVVMAPKREHSRKPDEIQERIEKMYPNARKLEVFARQQREGWAYIGNEIKFQ